MEILCPSCNKANLGDVCQRCGCELGALFAVRRAAAVELAAAAAALRKHGAGETDEAVEAVEEAAAAAARAWDLFHTPEAARIGFLASIALGDAETAGWWLRRTG